MMSNHKFAWILKEKEVNFYIFSEKHQSINQSLYIQHHFQFFADKTVDKKATFNLIHYVVWLKWAQRRFSNCALCYQGVQIIVSYDVVYGYLWYNPITSSDHKHGERFREAGQPKWNGFSLNFNAGECLAALKRLLTKARSGFWLST